MEKYVLKGKYDELKNDEFVSKTEGRGAGRGAFRNFRGQPPPLPLFSYIFGG